MSEQTTPRSFLAELDERRIERGKKLMAETTPFLAEHHRRPTAKRDGIAAWLKEQIAYLESIGRTEFGEGSLSAYKTTLQELERD